MYFLFYANGIILVKHHAFMLDRLVADGGADEILQFLIRNYLVKGVFVTVNLVVGVVLERKQVAQLGKAEVHFEELG